MFDTIIHRWLRIPYRLHVHAHHAPKRYKSTVVFLHGIGNTGAAWDRVIGGLPEDTRIISLDLLGFGSSPRPKWAVYSVKTQARSVIATIVSLRLSGRVILVGHSLGALVAVETAKRYPVLVKSMVLCSAPFYDEHTDKNIFLKTMFRQASKRPDQFVRLAEIAAKYNLVNKSFDVNASNVETYLATLGASILSQTSLDDAKKLKKPMVLLFGSLDPWVKKRNLKAITGVNPQAELEVVLAGHEVRGLYIPKAVEAITRQL